MIEHKIVKGETLSHLAKKYGISLQEIINANPGINPDLLQINQIINIPKGKQSQTATKSYSYSSNTSPYLTNADWRSKSAKFRSKFEEFHDTAYKDTFKNPGTWTIGTGRTFYLDSNLNRIRSVQEGDTTNETEDAIQLERLIKYYENGVKNRLKNFDYYPPELKFQIMDAVFNLGEPKFWGESPKYIAALKKYEADKGWENKNYPLENIFKHADWNLNSGGWISIRSVMRMNPQGINPSDLDQIYKLDKSGLDSLYNAYRMRAPLAK